MLAGPTPKYPCETKPCPDCPYGGPKVGSRGNPKARIVFVGEAPGAQEIVRKIPLVGPSGDVFWRTLPRNLRELGIDPDEDILILNSVQCLPPKSAGKDASKNQAAVGRAANICCYRLEDEIRAHPRDLVVAMGNHAVRSLMVNQGLKITQIRGMPLPYEGSRYGLLPTVHPAALLRGTGNYRQFREDIAYAIDLAVGKPRKNPVKPKWYVARDAQEVENICDMLSTWPSVACDTETGGFNHLTDEMLALGLCADPKKVYIIPGDLVKHTRRLFESHATRFIWHNGKFDLRFMRRDVGRDVRVDEDTMLLSYALDETGGIHDLEQVGNDFIGAPDYKNMLKPYLPNRKTSYRVIPKPILYEYLAYDTSNTRQIWSIARARVRADPALERLYTRVLIPASEFLYQVEARGIMLCQNRVERQRKVLQGEIDNAYTRLQAQAKKYGANAEVNPNSPKQLQVMLWDRIKLVPPTKGDRSTRKEVLERLPKHPFVEALRDFRKAAKAKSTYVTSLDKNVNVDGAVHATYLIHGTRTGRLSSRGPNMQNIPRSAALRGMYRARPGHVFIKVDLNQAELRSLACLSNDTFLVPLYKDSKRSLHRETAVDFFKGWMDRKNSAQGKEELMRAKAINFGVVYGRTAPSVANEFQISSEVAQQWIDRWFDRSPEAKKFIERCRSAPAKGTTLVTCFGRKKRHWIVTRENLNALQNEASNFPHQSIAGDICLLGAAKADRIFQELRERSDMGGWGIYPVNEVHDEAMFECPDHPEVIAWAKNVIIKCMESIPLEWGLTTVPFKAEADVGRRWSIYRHGVGHEYEYTGDNDGWATPTEGVLQALKLGAENARVLEAKLEGVRKPRAKDSADQDDDDGDLLEGDASDSDWFGSEAEAPWGYAPSTEHDHRLDRELNE